jgi:hypothetical protein
VQVEKEEAERERDAVLEQHEEQREARRAQEDDMLWLKAQQAASSLRTTNSTFEMEKEVLQLRRDKEETEEQVLLLQQEQEQAREREREREEQVLLLQHEKEQAQDKCKDAIAAMQAQEAKIICLTALEEEVSNSRVLIAHELRASYLELRACQQEMHSLKAKGAVGVGLLEMLAECTRMACKQVTALIADTKDLQERSLELELNERSLRVSVRHHSIPSVFD